MQNAQAVGGKQALSPHADDYLDWLGCASWNDDSESVPPSFSHLPNTATSDQIVQQYHGDFSGATTTSSSISPFPTLEFSVQNTDPFSTMPTTYDDLFDHSAQQLDPTVYAGSIEIPSDTWPSTVTQYPSRLHEIPNFEPGLFTPIDDLEASRSAWQLYNGDDLHQISDRLLTTPENMSNAFGINRERSYPIFGSSTIDTDFRSNEMAQQDGKH
jgi:hypothetical protein